MRIWPRQPKTRRLTIGFIIVLVAALGFVVWRDHIFVFFTKAPSRTRILVLDNNNTDFKKPPFTGKVTMFAADGKSLWSEGGLNTCQTVGGSRAVSVAPDGRFFLVCETVGQKLIAFETSTDKRLWTLDGDFTSAAISDNGTIFALTSSGTIYGYELLLIAERGIVVNRSKTGGFDIVLDSGPKVPWARSEAEVWLVGGDIKVCDLALGVRAQVDPFAWCAVSVDLDSDGAAWVAEREHPQVKGSKNRLLKFSPGAQVLKTIDLQWSPAGVRVDRSDGSVWATGGEATESLTARLLERIEKWTGRLPLGKKTRDYLTRRTPWARTHKYNARGELVHEIKDGGHSLDIDRSDGSVWIAGRKKLHHYSRDGRRIPNVATVSDDQKWIAVLPETRQDTKGDVPRSRR